MEEQTINVLMGCARNEFDRRAVRHEVFPTLFGFEQLAGIEVDHSGSCADESEVGVEVGIEGQRYPERFGVGDVDRPSLGLQDAVRSMGGHPHGG